MFSLFRKRKTIITHNGSFHADDVFACATLLLMDEFKNAKVIRTRDESIIKTGDCVFDVGGIYDSHTRRFDHHQKDGAGSRENGIPYAAFGLVWKEFGGIVCGDKEIADKIDKKLVAPIDAIDNGVEISKPLFEDIFPYDVGNYLGIQKILWNENNSLQDSVFMKQVNFAKDLIKREIQVIQSKKEAYRLVEQFYSKSADPRLLVLDIAYPSKDFTRDHEAILFVIYPDEHKRWRIQTISKEKGSFENRKDLPASWAGLRDQDLVDVTGVSDATFVHNKRFIGGAKSKEGILKLAELALQN